MDALDRLILNELSYQCRISFSRLAGKFEVSLTTIKNRVESLVEEGVILNFVAQLPLDILNASFAIITLDIKNNSTREDLISLGNHPFIMALGIGYELQGFAIAIYRTNDELNQAVNHLYSSNLIQNAQPHPVVAPPTPVDRSLGKGIDNLKKIDWKILKSLQWDGRRTLGDISSDVGASVPTVRKRMEIMRKNSLIHETIQINPAATSRRFVVALLMRSPMILKVDHFELEKMFQEEFKDSYWVSFRMVGQPELMLTFVTDSAKQVAPIRSKLVSMFESTEIIHQMIVPEWIYFPDFRDEMVDEHLK